MVRTQVFTHSLSLILRLVDTTTGRNIPGRETVVRINADAVRFVEKEGGLLVFQNLGLRTFHLEVDAAYYETVRRDVDLDALDSKQPLVELQLIPGKSLPGMAELQEVEGRLPGIRELTAVSAGDNSCLIQEFDPRKKLMKLFNPHHLALERIAYALVDPDTNQYEIFHIVKRIDNQTIKIDRSLEMSFRNSFPISPVVTGRCDPDGDYRLCLRREMGGTRWLIRWMAGEEVFFRLVDFRETPHPQLE